MNAIILHNGPQLFTAQAKFHEGDEKAGDIGGIEFFRQFWKNCIKLRLVLGSIIWGGDHANDDDLTIFLAQNL